MMLKIQAEDQDYDNRCLLICRHGHHLALLASNARGHEGSTKSLDRNFKTIQTQRTAAGDSP